jgi:hypothetical protein
MEITLMLKDVYSTTDEGKGLVRLTWQQVRERVQVANPTLCALIDEVNPSDDYAFYVAYYPYGALIGDDKTTYIPTMQGELLPLNVASAHLGKQVMDDLGYGANSAPLTMVMDKGMELFFDRKEFNLTLPCKILNVGDLTSTKSLLNKTETNSILHAVAGCRSAIMLPPISCTQHFSNLQRKFKIRNRKPKHLYQHGEIFSSLAQEERAGCTWKMCTLLFCQKFIEKIKIDPTWYKIYLYIFDYATQTYLHREHIESFMNVALTDAQKKQGLKIDPYIADTIHHLYRIAAGLTPGFAPASDDTYLPREFLQRVFVEVYGLDKYHPTIFHPAMFNTNDTNAAAVYYSYHYPTTFASSLKIRNAATILHELGELQYALDELKTGLEHLKPNLANALWINIGRTIDFSIYHSHNSPQKNIKLNGHLPAIDPRFGEAGCALNLEDRYLCDEGSFARGCVAINLKA